MHCPLVYRYIALRQIVNVLARAFAQLQRWESVHSDLHKDDPKPLTDLFICPQLTTIKYNRLSFILPPIEFKGALRSLVKRITSPDHYKLWQLENIQRVAITTM